MEHPCGAEQRALFDVMGIGVGGLILDRELSVLWMNEALCRQTGYTRAELTARFPTLRQYYAAYPADFQALRKALREAFGRGEAGVQQTVRLPVKNGGTVWMRLSAVKTGDETEGGPAITISFTDINELMCEKERTQRYFEMTMDEYAGNIYISDMESYELLYVNRTACQTLQLPAAQVLGRKCYEVIQGRDTPCPFCTNDRLCEEEFYEWQFFNPVLARTFMIKNRVVNWDGRRARIELSHDMYSLEFKLAQKDREREALIRSIPGGLARLDARDCSTILWYAADFLDMIGYTAEQFETELHSQCTYVHPEDLARVFEAIRPMHETGQNCVFECRLLRRSGEQRIATVTLCYVAGEDSWDGIPSFYSIGLDVTEERAKEGRQRKALEEAYQAARVANSAKTDFLSSMSHDIRTPMNAIVGMTAIARANLNAPDRVRDCLGKIEVSSRHLLSLINEVLDMSKIESGKIDLALEEVRLPELVQSVSDMCRPLLAEKRQELKILVGQVRHETVVTDGDRLRQVFMNLLSNAVKYTPEGGKISLTIRESAAASPRKGQFEFVFTDNGIGMSAEFLPHIFEPFTRAEDSRISKTQGTGLGMAITENIVHMMNGTIEVVSELGKGSTFTVAIPLGCREEEEAHEEELAGLPVLVVDDDRVVCENAALLLDELGMRGAWVLSGAEAVHSVAEAHERGEDFFAVILDWKMPGMDGLQTLRAIRKRLSKNVPIIVISAYDFSEIEDAFLHAGADAFITKPLFKSKMLHVLQLFIESGQGGSDTPGSEADGLSLAGKRVLLVEDNDLNREIAKELLEMRGILVDEAENGEQAVTCFRDAAPGYYTAILMDIQMPVMDGYEATAAIRALPRADAGAVPILALTANAFVSDVSRAQHVGMNDHIAKPIDVDHLICVLKKWMG